MKHLTPYRLNETSLSPAKERGMVYGGEAKHPNYETTYANFEMKQVYKKQTEENKYLGIDDEDKKEYTMDVILKREYSIGGSANVSTKASGS